MKYLFWFFSLMVIALPSKGQTSRAEETGFWTSSTNWIGGIVPGTSSAGTTTLNSNTVIIDGTMQVVENLTLNLSNLTINDGDTLVVLGDVAVNGSLLTNNGVLVVLGNLANTLSNSYVSGTGQMVVTGDYSNALGANTFTGPTYIYGSSSGFPAPPAAGDEADLQADNSDLYDYTNDMQTALPVELTSFDAKVVDHKVEINWTTASEENNDYFLLERSSDGINFELLLKTIGAGTTSNTTDYTEIDRYPIMGLSYYRLTQVDFDGKSTTFKIISVLFDGERKIEVYPNPTTDYIFLNIHPNDFVVDLRNSNGLSENFFGQFDEYNGQYKIDLRNIPTGVYVLRIVGVNDSSSTLHRIIKR